MSQKPDRVITVYIEDLVDVPKGPDEPQATLIKIIQRKRQKVDGKYQDCPSEETDVLMALSEALAMALSQSDGLVDEVMENGMTVCNIMMTKLAQLLHLDEDDVPKLLSDFEDIPEELEKKVKLLAPLFAEFKNKH